MGEAAATTNSKNPGAGEESELQSCSIIILKIPSFQEKKNMQRNKKYGPLTGKREIHRSHLHRPRVRSLGPAPASWNRTSPLSAGGHLRLNLNTNSIRISKALERSLVSILKVTSKEERMWEKPGKFGKIE